MKIVIPGGTGQVGTILARAFSHAGHDVVLVSRRHAQPNRKWVEWDGRTLGPWAAEVDGADVVVNLAGRNVNCRYTPANRQRIMDSRLQSTRIVGEAIARAARPPRVWIQASTATIYSHRLMRQMTNSPAFWAGKSPTRPDRGGSVSMWPKNGKSRPSMLKRRRREKS